ncbi:MAG: hypothetical protein QNJ36_09050 [Calothrix sp. MO_167.B42]|nr:hypothetical protein [Calothrix sp. MO_167.B42]
MSFCTTGELAKVTLPDGNIQEFTDTPITIKSKKLPVGEFGIAGRLYYQRGGSSNFTYYNGRVYGPVVDVYVQHHAPFYSVRSVSYTGSYGQFSQTPGIRVHGTFTFAITISDWYFVPDNGFPLRPEFEITVTGNSGNQLFQKNYITDNYSVECVQGCPPGSISCGNCCLNCSDLLKDILKVRRRILNLK